MKVVCKLCPGFEAHGFVRSFEFLGDGAALGWDWGCGWVGVGVRFWVGVGLGWGFGDVVGLG